MLQKTRRAKMESNKVNMYISQYKDKIPSEKTVALRNALTNASETCEDNLSMVKIRNPIVILIISIFLGTLGIDRFMIGDIGLGVCKLLIGWLTLGIWYIIDIFLCYKKAKEMNFNEIMLSLN